MLKYLIETTNSLFTIAILIGFMLAFLEIFYQKIGKKIAFIGLAVGLLLSFVRSMIFNTHRIVNGWKVGYYVNFFAFIIFFVSIITFVVMNILFNKLSFFRDETNLKANKIKKITTIAIPIIFIVTLDAYIFNTVNDFWFLPFSFYNEEVGVLSSEYLLNLLGYLIGLVIAIALTVSTYKVVLAANKKNFKYVVASLFFISYLLFEIYVFAKLVATWNTRNIYKNLQLFNFSIFSSNHQQWYGYINLALLIGLCIFMWIESYIVKEAHANNAEYRKQKVVWRTPKRVSIFAILSMVVFILCQTWFVELNRVIIVETPLETPAIIKDALGNDEKLVVSLEAVSDGHLHKFEYVTEDKYKTRFIIILKQPNTSNYGVGLDACEICGEAGYYENQNGEVVCKKCGVVMNTMTIGMKGGCNPILIDYDFDTDFTCIYVPVSEMVNNQTKFSK